MTTESFESDEKFRRQGLYLGDHRFEIYEVRYEAKKTGGPASLELIARVGELANAKELFGRFTPNELSFCMRCDSELVYPIGWEERPGDAWQLVCRCPDCELRTEFTAADSKAIESYDEVLNEGTDKLINTLHKLTHENMEIEAEVLADAINNDHIQPMDF